MVERITSVEFAQVFTQRSGQLAWLLGAGASAAAGIPTGWDMIVDFKVRLFCSATRIPRGEVDVSDPLWVDRITDYFDGAHGLPPAGDPDEYAAAFEAVFPQPRDRRAYLDDAIRRGTPSFGHRVLAALITDARVPCVFTTNFDQLVERATTVADDLVPATAQAHLTIGALDSVDRAVRCASEGTWPLLVKLHGDYQSEQLKNTPIELQEQDRHLREVMIQALGRFGLVVVGYSGRDHSIIDALNDVLARPSPMPGGIWWVAQPGTALLPRVTELLEAARTVGVETHVVESENFDELAGDIERTVALPGELRTHLDHTRPRPLVEPVQMPTAHAASFPVLRCSALELLAWPETARAITLQSPLTSPQARRLVRDADVWATVAARGTAVSAFGSDINLSQAFQSHGAQLDGVVTLDPEHDSVDRGLLYDAFLHAATRRRPLRAVLRARGHMIIVQPPPQRRDDPAAAQARSVLDELKRAYQAPLTGTVPRIDLRYAEAVRVRLEHWAGRWFFVYEPFTWVGFPRVTAEATESADTVLQRDHGLTAVAADWRRERWATRYNPQWDRIIAAWAKLIAPSERTELAAHHFAGEGVNAGFTLSWTTAWSRPGRARTEAPC